MKQLITLSALLSLLLFNSCDEDDELTQTITLEFRHVFDDEEFEVGDKRYKIASGQEVMFSEFKYYISNIKFESGEHVYEVPNSYHLIEVRPNGASTYVLVLKDVPLYFMMNIELSIGIDQDANLNMDRAGDLDPSNNMAWDWNTGYKFIRVEGEFTDTDGNRRGLVMHPGEEANYKRLSLTKSTIVNDGVGEDDLNSRFIFRVNVAELFRNPNTIDLEEQNSFMFLPNSAVIGENYANGFIEVMN